MKIFYLILIATLLQNAFGLPTKQNASLHTRGGVRVRRLENGRQRKVGKLNRRTKTTKKDKKAGRFRTKTEKKVHLRYSPVISQNGQAVKRELPNMDLALTASDERMKELGTKPLSIFQKFETSPNTTLTIDILSIGSKSRYEYMHGQIDTWASHKSVRTFWGLTEEDDYNTTCSTMTESDVDQLADKCKSKLGIDEEIEKFVNHFYAMTEAYIHRFDPGWICAQRRVARGLGALRQAFDVEKSQHNFPDYLLIVDDDTFFDVVAFEEYLESTGIDHSSQPHMLAGCIIEANDMFPYSFPYGGFALAINKEAIVRLYTPVYCDGTKEDMFTQKTCDSLQEDRIGELSLFRNGMSLVELFHTYAAIHTFCMHSDWLTGYVATYYPLSDKGGSALSGIKKFPESCGNFTLSETLRMCEYESGICHNQGPKDQEFLAKVSYSRAPGAYKHEPELRESVTRNLLEKRVSQVETLESTETDSTWIALPDVIIMSGNESDPGADLSEWLFAHEACRPDTITNEKIFANFTQTTLKDFATRYSHCDRKSMIMDVIPNALPYPDVLDSIYKEAGGTKIDDVKLVIVVTEPVQKELELYNHMVNGYLLSKNLTGPSMVTDANGRVKSFQEYVEEKVLPEIHTGKSHVMYVNHLRRWISFVDRKQILVISDVELKAKPEKVQWRIRTFLGKKLPGSMEKYHESRNNYQNHDVPCEVQEKLHEIFDPLNEDLYSFLASFPGHTIEQTPFPHFNSPDCVNSRPVSLPNTLVIGAQKAGSLSLANWLLSNEKVCGPRTFDGEPKYFEREPHFFDQTDRYNQGIDFYARRFQNCDHSSIVLDATPNTMDFAGRVRKIYEAAGGQQAKSVKIILTVREPIFRELSYYNQLAEEYRIAPNQTAWYGIVAGNDGSIMSFGDFVENVTLPSIKEEKQAHKGSLSRVGLYADDLRDWVRLFNRENILVLDYTEMRKDPITVQNRVSEFLGLELEGVLQDVEDYHRFVVDYPLCDVKDRLENVFASKNEELYDLLASTQGPAMESRPFPKFEIPLCIDRSTNVVPNILLIGAPKAGTTSIAEWLFENGVCRPRVFGDEPDYFRKEVHFFDLVDRYEHGLEFYARRFEHCYEKAFIMDATPDTLPFPERVSSVYEQAGGDRLRNAKIIVVLREPVSRELSLYNHKVFDYIEEGNKTDFSHDIVKENGSVMGFDEYVEDILIGRIKNKAFWTRQKMGLYALHLKKWLQIVERGQILVISYNELKYSGERVQERVREFLGYNFPGPLAIENAKSNTKKISMPSCRSQRLLNSIFKPANEELYELLNQTVGPAAEGRPFTPFEDQKCLETPARSSKSSSSSLRGGISEASI